jgi:hypothetical protein
MCSGVGQSTLFWRAFICDNKCPEEVIVGAKTLQAWHIVLDFSTETVIYRKTAQRLRI